LYGKCKNNSRHTQAYPVIIPKMVLGKFPRKFGIPKNFDNKLLELWDSVISASEMTYIVSSGALNSTHLLTIPSM